MEGNTTGYLVTIFSLLCLHFSVTSRNGDDILTVRLPSTSTSEFFPIFRHNDCHFRENDYWNCYILSTPPRHRSRFSPKFYCVRRPIMNVTKRSLESSNGHVVVLGKILNSMTQALLQSPDFDFYGNLRPPFGLILFYVYTSVVTIRMCFYSVCLID